MSKLCTILKSIAPTHSQVSHVLTEAIAWLNGALGCNLERNLPNLLPLNGVVTFKDYSSDISNWLTSKGEQESLEKATAKVLVYGQPSAFKYRKLPQGLDEVLVHTIVKNIIMRLKVRVFGSSRLQVTTLDCTKPPIRIPIHPSALTHVPSVDELNRSILDRVTGEGAQRSRCDVHYTYDGEGTTWTPAVMFKKIRKEGPLPDFTYDFFKVTILIVPVHKNTLLKDLADVFRECDTV